MSALPVPEGRGLRRLPLRHPPRHRTSIEGRPVLRARTTSISSSARTTWSPSTTATRGRSASCAITPPATRRSWARGRWRCLHRIVDAMVDSLPAGDGQARGPARRAREADLRQARRRSWSRRFSTRSGRSPGCGASSRRSATSSARLARRDFVDISTEMSFRFRDVYDHLRPDRRRCDDLPGPDHRHARRAPRRTSATG